LKKQVKLKKEPNVKLSHIHVQNNKLIAHKKQFITKKQIIINK